MVSCGDVGAAAGARSPGQARRSGGGDPRRADRGDVHPVGLVAVVCVGVAAAVFPVPEAGRSGRPGVGLSGREHPIFYPATPGCYCLENRTESPFWTAENVYYV